MRAELLSKVSTRRALPRADRHVHVSSGFPLHRPAGSETRGVDETDARAMHLEIARAWSVLLIRGICNVLFALVAFLQPELALLTLVLVWGVYAVVDGAMALTTGIAARRAGEHDWSLVVAGASGLVAGITACVWPGVTLALLLAIISIWALVRGALEIAAAIRLRHVLPRQLAVGVVGSRIDSLWRDAARPPRDRARGTRLLHRRGRARLRYPCDCPGSSPPQILGRARHAVSAASVSDVPAARRRILRSPLDFLHSNCSDG